MHFRRRAFTKTLRIMKLMAFILLAGFLQVSAHGYSQTVTLNEKNAPLQKIFKEINRQTGYQFFYKDEVLDQAGKINIRVSNMPLEDALAICFKNLPFTFSIVEKTIVVKKKEEFAPPPIDVHGRVTDSLGNPIQGASVTVKGTHKGIQTDANGNFTLKGIAPNSTIIVSIVGYEEQQVKLDERNDIIVVMKQGVTSMHDVVISKGYYNTTDQLNTGDVTTVSGAVINQQPVSDPILALEGRVPGLYIQQTSGMPGAYSQIQIRGQNSIANGNDPLYIVDGVPFSSTSLTSPYIGGGAVGYTGGVNYNGGGYNNNAVGNGLSPFNALNPADIESIVVLKDADATAIYGSRGANGVILITTKRGKAGATRFDLNVYTGGGEVARMMPMLNTTQYLAMRRQSYQNDGLPIPSILTNPSDNNFDINGVWDTTRYTNWQKVLIGNVANFTNAQGSISGGSANTQFLVGGGYSKQGTVFIGNSSDQKASAHINLTHTSTDQKFHLQLNVNYVYDNNNLPSSDFTPISITLAPDAPALYTNGSLNWQMYNGGSTFYNPAASTLNQAHSTTNNLVSNLNLSYDILPGLKLSSSFGYNHNEMHQLVLYPASANPPPYNTVASNRVADFSTSTFETWIIEPQLNYKRNLGAGRIEVLLGSTFQQNVSNSVGQYALGFASDALLADPQAASDYILAGANNTLYHYNAVYGRIGYSYDDKYLINITARRDGSSRFGPGKQFGNFGSAGIGWIFSKERLIQDNLPFLSFGKLKASYGITGNDQIADYQYLSTYSPLSPTYQGITGLLPTSLTNPYFAWELVRKMEGGIELGFIKDRILVSASYFRNRTGNQLVGEPLPAITGFTTVQANLPAIVQNTGLEMTLTSVIIKQKNFTWTIRGNLTLPSNKLVSFPNLSSTSYADRYVVGKSLFIQELYHYTGVNPQTGLYSFQTKGPNRPEYPQDLILTKPVTQKYYGGFNNEFLYKGFSLDIFVQFVDQLGYSYNRNLGMPGITNQNIPVAGLNAWQTIGEQTNIQRFGTGSTYTTVFPFDYFQRSDGIITNASFIRLKNLAIGYQLPVNLKTQMHLQSIRVYVQCQNLLTITKYQGMDPETGGFNLPPLRMITAGLQVGF
jgi:TonB-dependent starch-binding outer membrane protein SusC